MVSIEGWRLKCRGGVIGIGCKGKHLCLKSTAANEKI
jgi:hypothetical protein